MESTTKKGVAFFIFGFNVCKTITTKMKIIEANNMRTKMKVVE
jgi:hypothetical protein